MADAQQIQDLVVAFVRAFGLHRPDQTPCGQPVSVSEAHALMELGRIGPLLQKELVVLLQLDKSTVSRLVGKLRRRGWLDRESDPNDARAVYVCLTESGRQAAQQLAVVREAKFSQLIAALRAQDHEAVMRGLTALVQGMNRTKEEEHIVASIAE
jgi:DNA-binding MarR family transcriptional regulator